MSDEISIHNHESWIRAVESGNNFYLTCLNGQRWLPSPRVCKLCGSTTLEQESLPEVGTIKTYTKIHISPPQFEHEDVVAIAITDFEPRSCVAHC